MPCPYPVHPFTAHTYLHSPVHTSPLRWAQQRVVRQRCIARAVRPLGCGAAALNRVFSWPQCHLDLRDCHGELHGEHRVVQYSPWRVGLPLSTMSSAGLSATWTFVTATVSCMGQEGVRRWHSGEDRRTRTSVLSHLAACLEPTRGGRIPQAVNGMNKLPSFTCMLLPHLSHTLPNTLSHTFVDAAYLHDRWRALLNGAAEPVHVQPHTRPNTLPHTFVNAAHLHDRRCDAAQRRN